MDLQTRDRAATDVEALPPGQPGVPVPGADRGQTAGAGQSAAPLNAWAQLALAALVLVALGALALHMDGTKPRHEALRAFPDTIRALAATVVLFGVTGFGLTRLCLPNALRRYEPLWVLPTGACAVGLAMTVLGFAYVPYLVSLVLVLAAGVAL